MRHPSRRAYFGTAKKRKLKKKTKKKIPFCIRYQQLWTFWGTGLAEIGVTDAGDNVAWNREGNNMV